MQARTLFSPRNLLALLLVGVAVALGLFLQSGDRTDSPPEQEEDSNAAFTILEAAHREFDGAPALALSFSLPLDARARPGEFIQVLEMPARPEDLKNTNDDAPWHDEEQAPAASEVSSDAKDTQLDGGKTVPGAWVVGENPRLLFFPGIKPQTRYLIRIQGNLAARNGKTLGAEQRYAIRTAAVTPAFYFASRGMVLPAGQNGGLPVTTVNVPEVDIQFLKVKPDSLPAFLDKVTQGKSTPRTADEEEYYDDYDRTDLKGAINSWTLDRLHTMTTSVYAGRFNTEPKANRRSVTFIPVEDIPELREPGVYIAVMTQPNRFRSEQQTTYFYISDLGLHLRDHAAGSADAFVSSLVDGKAVRDVDVSWLDADGKVLGQARTDGDGRAAFAERPHNARIVIARKGEQLSLIALKEPALDLSEFDTAGLVSSPIRLFAYSGRDLYRPGESFAVSVLARDTDGHPVPAQPIQALLRRPDGKAQWTTNWSPSKAFSGHYQQQIDLPADAATGTWRLELRGDPAARHASTSLNFNVEEFLPERMKLDPGPSSGTLTAGANWQLAVQGTYLYGAPTAGNRLLGVVNTTPNPQALPGKLPGFIFGDADEATVRQRQELEEIALDAQGKAQLEVDLSSLDNRRSPFTVRATLSLLESGGRPVIRSVERTWWPAPALVGLRPLFKGEYARENSSVEFETVLADAQGRLHAAKALPVRIFRENRDWYWRFDDQRGWHSGFTETDELVASSTVDIPAGGRGKLLFPVKHGRYRVEVLNPETQLVSRYRFYAGWFAKDDESQGVRPDRVALKFDKANYREGETARLTLTPPHAGEALITVEGDRLLWSKRIQVGSGDTRIDLPIAPDWKRHDLYVTAMVLRPGNSGSKITPARALGIAYLPLSRDERRLTVSLDAPKKMEPDRPLKVKIKVPEAKGHPAMVTLSAVDSGILGITGFKSPDPFAFFFAKLRYGQDLYDVYGRLIEKMAGRKGKLKWGGDAAPSATRSLPKKVRLVDLFSGPVALDANGEAEISLPVPDFNGKLRLMAVASSAGRFGMQETEVTIAAPLVVELATPRFLSIGDAALLALDVHNLAGSAQEVSIQVSNTDGLLLRNPTQKVTLQDQEKRILRIPLEAGSAHGLTEVQVRIDSPRSTLTRTFPLQVQAPTPRQTLSRRYIIEPGASLDIRESDLGGFLPQTANANLTLSDKPPIDVRSAVRGLLTYPYGCVEQTTSTAYPHLFIDEEAARKFDLKVYSPAQRAAMLDTSIARLAGMQAPNGGFSLWGNHGEYEYWLSAYVTHFLNDAREQGFAVPAEMEKKALEFLLKGLQEGVATLPRGPLRYNRNSTWSDWRYAGSGRFGVLAYGAYVLALHGRAPLATLRQLAESSEQSHSGLALVHLGLALKLMGDEPRSQASIDAALKKPRDNRYWWGDYGSTLRDSALMYVLLKKHKLAPEGLNTLVDIAAGELEKNRYLSTQERMAAFLLGQDFARSDGNGWQASLMQGKSSQTLSGKGMQFMAIENTALARGIKLTNSDTSRLFVSLELTGNPAKPPPARSDAFALKRSWYTADGKPLGERPLRVGESLLLRLEVTTHGDYANAMIVDYIPAGIEIENTNIIQSEQNELRIDNISVSHAMQDARIKHVEFRDDRFVVAARLSPGTTHFFYRARVVTPGRFIVPPSYAEDMYQPAIYGLSMEKESIRISDGEKH